MPNEAGKGTETLSRMECEAVPTEGEVAIAGPRRGVLFQLNILALESLIRNITEKELLTSQHREVEILKNIPKTLKCAY